MEASEDSGSGGSDQQKEANQMSFDNSAEEDGEPKSTNEAAEKQLRARRMTKVDELLRRSQTNAF